MRASAVPLHRFGENCFFNSKKNRRSYRIILNVGHSVDTEMFAGAGVQERLLFDANHGVVFAGSLAGSSNKSTYVLLFLSCPCRRGSRFIHHH